MKANFETALAGVLVHEGGYSNHPSDPGGPTNKGITWRTYDAWRTKRGLPEQDVRNITDREVAAIYRAQYWNAIRGDDLPSGLDYAVFDFAVNSGSARAAQFLQRILGVAADGQIGEITLAAIRDLGDDDGLIRQLCKDRLAWLKRLSIWPKFGRGWERRVNEVQAKAVAMADGHSTVIESGVPVPGRADGPVSAQATMMDALTDPRALTAAGGFLTSLGAVSQGTGPVQIAFAIVLVLAALVGLFLLVKQAKGRE